MKLQNSTLFHIIHIGKLLERKVEQVMQQEFSISHSDAKLLILIHTHPDLSQTILAEAMAVSPAAVSRQIGKLVNYDLLNRETDPDSRRNTIISLTQKGSSTVTKVIERFTQILYDLEKENETFTKETYNQLIQFENQLEQSDNMAQKIRLQITQ